MTAGRLSILTLFVLSAPAALAQLAATVDPPELSPPAGQATVYFYRAGGPGKGVDAWTFVDKVVAGVIRDKQYTGTNVAAGEHVIWASADYVGAARERFESGQTYYIKLEVNPVDRPNFESTTAYTDEVRKDIERARYRQLTAAGQDRAAEVYARDYAVALEAMALDAAEAAYSPASSESLQAIYAYAEKLEQTGRLAEARNEYDRSMRLIEERHGESSVLLVEAYRHFAATYRRDYPGFMSKFGLSALRSALEVLEQQEEPDPEELAGVLLELGDAYTVAGGSKTDYYLRAWDALEPLENADEIRRNWFAPATTTFLQRAPISTRGLSFAPNAQWGSVLLEFDVDKFGEPRDVEVLSSQPGGFKEADAIRALRLSRFRPRVENREFVPSEGMRAQYLFTYLPEDIRQGN